MRDFAKRVARLEVATKVMLCTCAARPSQAVIYEDERKWNSPTCYLYRAAEEAKFAFTCPTHGHLGPKIVVRRRSFASSICGGKFATTNY